MKINILLISFILLFFMSCSNEENSLNNRLESYHFKYMDYPSGMALNLTLDNLVKIHYDYNNKITKRVGGILYLSSGSGFSTMFSDYLYDEVDYSFNQIKIKRKMSLENYSTPTFERILFIDNHNRITKKIIYDQTTHPYTKDTIIYSYDNYGLLTESYKGNLNSYNEKTKYYYNQDRNLDSIVRKKHYGNEPYYDKEKEVFSNYDSALNPLKKLIIFEETFIRALSKNNYAKCEIFKYNGSNNLYWQETKTWDLFYDENGNVNFNLF